MVARDTPTIVLIFLVLSFCDSCMCAAAAAGCMITFCGQRGGASVGRMLYVCVLVLPDMDMLCQVMVMWL